MQLILGFLLAVGVTGLAYRLHLLSRSGAAAAVLLGALVFSLGGLEWAILLVAFFGASSGLTRFSASWLSAGSPKSGPPVPKIGIPKIGMRSAMRIAMRSAKVRGHREAQPDCRTQAQRNQDLSASFSKGGQRDAGQVLANGGLAGLFVVAHAVWPDQNWPWAAFAGTLAAVNADTWATELGVLSSALPRIITTFNPAESTRSMDQYGQFSVGNHACRPNWQPGRFAARGHTPGHLLLPELRA
jgi:hypothetical protein